MSLLTFDNPVFRYYAIAAALMIVKMMSQGWITVFRMIRVIDAWDPRHRARYHVCDNLLDAD